MYLKQYNSFQHIRCVVKVKLYITIPYGLYKKGKTQTAALISARAFQMFFIQFRRNTFEYTATQ